MQTRFAVRLRSLGSSSDLTPLCKWRPAVLSWQAFDSVVPIFGPAVAKPINKNARSNSRARLAEIIFMKLSHQIGSGEYRAPSGRNRYDRHLVQNHESRQRPRRR